ncbi:hypothetical protein GQ42DRAFT_154003 [Ramicandelaber brevisporus]|nr:hypothetical protein GQ42DRAFT_154003 [Ramicandelaber brevisporus]
MADETEGGEGCARVGAAGVGAGAGAGDDAAFASVDEVELAAAVTNGEYSTKDGGVEMWGMETCDGEEEEDGDKEDALVTKAAEVNEVDAAAAGAAAAAAAAATDSVAGTCACLCSCPCSFFFSSS